MSRYVFDIETDGLLTQCTRCWIIAVQDLETRKVSFWLEGEDDWKEVFDNAELLVGHNIRGFDIPALEKLFGWKPNPKTKIRDTLIYSQILNYKRFPSGSHSLEAWGEFLGKPKQEHEDWSQYSEEMRTRCISDVELNVLVYKQLVNEYKTYASKVREPEYLRMYIEAEHAVSEWCAQAQLKGWPFDRKKAEPLFETMTVELEAARNALMPKLGMKCIAVDKKKGVVEEKIPKYIKSGDYNHHTCNWFSKGLPTIEAWEGRKEPEDRPIVGPYCRVEFAALDIDSVEDMKIFLFRNGWQPTDWNFKFNEATGERVRTSPKITEDSLEFLGGDGTLYVNFLTTRSRWGVLKGWLENCGRDDRVHGDCFTIGTPSFRARHSIIVNVPGMESTWGPEMRELFTVSDGWSFIGADSASNQARGLAHFLKNDEFTDQLINGDIHIYNANILDRVLAESCNFNWTAFIKRKSPEKDEKDIAKTKRAAAKRILYAFLFGASGGKLWLYITGTLDDKLGKKLKSGFTKAVPGFKALMTKLENIYGKTSQFGDGYIPGLCGQRIYVDSFHKLLVYLLQATEKATVSGACLLLMNWLREENIPYQPLIMMHDELDFMVPDEYAERAAELAKKAFIEGPKLFGVTLMDGDAKIGNNWKECH